MSPSVERADALTTPAALRASVHVAERDVAVELAAEGPGVLAMVGPNGAGKSTVLQVLAGLLRPTRCRVELGDRLLSDLPGGAWVPAHRRRVTLLGQDSLVLPHLDVRDNVAFGPRSQGFGRRAAATEADRWMARLGVDHLADQRGSALSGGQAQRVALARALAARPDLLLLDEPLSALDVDVAAAMRQVLREVLRESGTRAVLVTHDVVDVAALAHEVAVLEGGRVVESGPVVEVLGSPRSAFGAAFVGQTLVRGIATGAASLALQDGTEVHGRGALAVGDPAIALWDPVDVAVHVGPVVGSPRTVIRARVVELVARSGAVRLWAATADGARVAADVTPLSVAELGLRPGVEVWLAIKAQAVRLLSAP